VKETCPTISQQLKLTIHGFSTTEMTGDLLADSHSIFNTWKNDFCHLLDVHGVNDARRTEMRIAEPLAPEPLFRGRNRY